MLLGGGLLSLATLRHCFVHPGQLLLQPPVCRVRVDADGQHGAVWAQLRRGVLLLHLLHDFKSAEQAGGGEAFDAVLTWSCQGPAETHEDSGQLLGQDPGFGTKVFFVISAGMDYEFFVHRFSLLHFFFLGITRYLLQYKFYWKKNKTFSRNKSEVALVKHLIVFDFSFVQWPFFVDLVFFNRMQKWVIMSQMFDHVSLLWHFNDKECWDKSMIRQWGGELFYKTLVTKQDPVWLDC